MRSLRGSLMLGRRAQLPALVPILLLAAALRVVNLGGRTLWYDEAFAVLFAEKGLSAMVEGTLAQEGGAAAEEHPLLYYALLGLWMDLVGQSPVMVRLLSLFAGVLTLAGIYLLGADLFGRSAGVVAVFVAALSPFHVQYAQEARMYALMALWLVLATWCYVRAARSPGRGWRWWGAFATFAALSMYTQQLAAFYLIALALFPVAARRWDLLGRVAVAGSGALALYLPWLVNLPGQLGKIQQAYWLAPPSLLQLSQTLLALAAPVLELPLWVITGGLVAALLAAALLAVRGLRVRRTVGWRLGLMLWLAFVPPALMFIAGQFLPVYLLRALLPCALMFYVALGWLVAQGRAPRMVVAGLAALWFTVGGAGLFYHYNWETFPNAPFDRAVAYIETHRQGGDIIMHSNKLTFLPMLYYGRDLPQTFVADPTGSPQDTLAPATQRALGVRGSRSAQVAAAGAARVWFVVFQREVAQTRDVDASSLGWLLANYTQADLVHFNDLDVYLFVEPDASARAAEFLP